MNPQKEWQSFLRRIQAEFAIQKYSIYAGDGVKYSGKLDPAKGNVITVPKEHKAMVEEIQKRTASTFSDQPRQQFMKVTEGQPF